MNCSGHQSPGLWTHPDDQSVDYKKASYWRELAVLLEKGKFDAVFIADVLGIYDVYEGSRDAAIRNGVQVPLNDPSYIVPIMSEATDHLSFGITASVTYEHPYSFARRMSTLDHLTDGRIAWNVVTSYLKSASVNLGLQQIPHDERYDLADEYMDVCYKLWEKSWEEDAVIQDKTRRIFTEPEKVHDIHHKGKYFSIPGAHLAEPSPQRTPVIFQAGASTRGRKFAVDHAELVFISSTSIHKIKETVQLFKEDLKHTNREADNFKIISMVTPIVAETTAEAEEKFEEYTKYASKEGALSLVSGWTGIDMAQLKADEKISYIENDAIRSTLKAFEHYTVKETASFVGVGGFGPVIVGNPTEIADALEAWMDETGIDGFNIAYTVTPGSFKDFIDFVVPILQARGRVQTAYKEGTFRKKLTGSNYLPHSHQAKRVQISKAEGMFG